jgi:hypothetical protein
MAAKLRIATLAQALMQEEMVGVQKKLPHQRVVETAIRLFSQ